MLIAGSGFALSTPVFFGGRPATGISVSIDGGTPVVVSTAPADGARHSNVAVCTSPGLAAGVHTIVVAKLSGQYATFDGLEVDNPA